MYAAIVSSTDDTNPGWFAIYSTIFLLICYSMSSYVHAETGDATVKQLSKKLEQRDAIIKNLLQRVEQLERRVGGFSPPNTKTAKSEQPKDAKPSKPAGPGTFEVDEKAAERALERTLTLGGALLLPAWSVEIQPFFSYSRNQEKNQVLTGVSVDNERFFGLSVVKQNNYKLGLITRIGLPFDSQLEFNIPYSFVDQTDEFSSQAISISAQGIAQGIQDKHTSSASEVGDITIGIAKTLIREKNWWPDVIGRFTWDTDTGKTQKGGIFLGDGFNELQFSFTALKRLDPLALFSTVSYQTTFERKNALLGDDYKPGDQYTLSLGVSLATSPETSLSASFQQTYSEEDERAGRKLFGTDQLASSLIFGASWIVGKGNLISFSPAIGLTEDAADYSANFAWSYRLR